MEDAKTPRMTTFGKRVVLALMAFFLIWPLTLGAIWLIYRGYTMIDQTMFPLPDAKLIELTSNTLPDDPDAQNRALHTDCFSGCRNDGFHAQ